MFALMSSQERDEVIQYLAWFKNKMDISAENFHVPRLAMQALEVMICRVANDIHVNDFVGEGGCATMIAKVQTAYEDYTQNRKPKDEVLKDLVDYRNTFFHAVAEFYAQVFDDAGDVIAQTNVFDLNGNLTVEVARQKSAEIIAHRKK